MQDKLYGVIVPTVTPFDEKGEVDLEGFRHNYEMWNETGVRGYMCLGTNGEFKAVSDDESLAIIRTASQARAGGKTLIAGVGRESLHETLAMIDRVAAEGIDVDYVSVLTPHYFASLMTDDALVGYFTAVADHSPYPVLLYCAPPYANNVCISVEAAQRLADHPNIHGLKDTSTNMMQSYMDALSGRDDFEVMAGSVNTFNACLRLGGHGGVLSAANYFPEECVKFYELFVAGDPGTGDYYDALRKLAKETGGRGGIAGVKCAMNILGYRGGLPRLPILPVAPEVEQAIREGIEAHEQG